MILPEMAINADAIELQTGKSFWFSSATAALLASLKAVKANGKYVAVQPNVCPNVIAAIYGAGCKPWFVDIEPQRQGIDPQRLSKVISNVSAVIAVHAYGVPCKIDQIAEVARKANVPIIEDCAQADGATYMGLNVGMFGDIAIFSYGTGKILDAGGGGLAIVNEHLQAAMQDTITDWPESEENYAGDCLGGTYRFFYNQFYPDNTALVQDSFLALIKSLAPSFQTVCRKQRIPYLIQQSGRLKTVVVKRRQKYYEYINQLAGNDYINSVPLLEGVAPWRFNLLIEKGKRNQIFKELLKSGIKASTWYPRISSFLPTHAFHSTLLPVATRFDQSLLNLWVDESVSDQDIANTCNFLKNKTSTFSANN